MTVALTELFDALVITGVDHGAVNQHQPYRGDGPVAVFLDAAAHAAGVVGKYAADFGGIDRGRVGADFAVERRQFPVGEAADDAGLKLDKAGIFIDSVVAPAPAQTDQDGVGDRLAGKAGTGSPEGDRQFSFAGFAQDDPYFVFVFHIDDDLRDQPIKTRIGTDGDRFQGIGDNPVLWNRSFNMFLKVFIYVFHTEPPVLIWAKPIKINDDTSPNLLDHFEPMSPYIIII